MSSNDYENFLKELKIFLNDEKLKEKMEKTCKDMGLSVTAAYTMFATKVTREQRIPFEVNADPFFSEENLAW